MNKNERETQEAQTVDNAAVIEAEIARLQGMMYAASERRDELYRAVIQEYDNRINSYSRRINALYTRLKELQS